MNHQDISRVLTIYSFLRRAGSESAVQIGDEVLDVLDADRYPDEVVGQAALLADHRRDCCVGHEAWQADEGLHAP